MENKQLAQGIASLGRYGDTTLMHMRPDEVQQLTAISRANGGDITINPDTGMPEAFLGDFFGALLPTAAGLAAGAIFPGAPILAPALAGGTTAFLQGKRDPLSIGMGALSGYGGAQLGSTLSGFGATKTAVPELAGTAEIAGGAGGTPVADAALTGQTLGATGGTTAGANAFGQEQFISPFTQQGAANAFGNVQNVTSSLQPTLPATAGATYAGPTGMAQTLPTPPTPAYRGPVSSAPRPNFGAAPSSPKDQLSAMADYTGDTSMMQSKRLGSFEEGIDLGKGLAETGRGFEAATKDPMGYLKFAGDGSALMGGVKTALPFAGAGLEAYQKGVYENMPTYEASTAGRYDPTRVLNLGMDTGLRLLAKGGQVQKYQRGGQAEYTPEQLTKLEAYGVVPQYQPVQIGLYSRNHGPQRQPVTGFVDVGGKFVAGPDGDITDVAYTDKFKYILEGPAKTEQGDGGDFEARAGLQGGAGGINPAVALQAAQGYAESQQSNLDEQGLGTLKTGGSVRRFQMGGTTAEKNMYGSQDSNEPAGLGSLTTAEQNLPGRQGMAGRTDLQNATTAEQNIAREPMQEAGTVVTQSAPSTSSNVVTMGKTKYDLSKAQGNVIQKDGKLIFGDIVDMFRTVDTTPTILDNGRMIFGNPIAAAGYVAQNTFGLNNNLNTAPTSSALNLNTGKQEPMAMGGRVRYAEGGETTLNLNTGKQEQLNPSNGNVLDAKVSFGMPIGSPDAMAKIQTLGDFLNTMTMRPGMPIGNPDSFDNIKTAGDFFRKAKVRPSFPIGALGLESLQSGGYLETGGRVRYAEGGISALTPDDGKMLNGNGDGVSDDIPAMIEGEQEAALSDGEFIVPARIVSELGNGSSDAGAKKLYAMIDRIQAARQQTMGDNKQYAKDTNAERFLPV